MSTVLTDYLLLRESDIGPARDALAVQGIALLPRGTANTETA